GFGDRGGWTATGDRPEGMPGRCRELELGGIQPRDPPILLPGPGGVHREPAGLSGRDGTAVPAGAQYRDREDCLGSAAAGGCEGEDLVGRAGHGRRPGVLRKTERRIRSRGRAGWEVAVAV